eukprot:GILJ01008048.1.p1 GENE.GILJ01008048.1~~GILJ01008048.1.p1  ORF type:complete len:228 (+),score=33.88 GILJ01008048.1:36-719(+)
MGQEQSAGRTTSSGEMLRSPMEAVATFKADATSISLRNDSAQFRSETDTSAASRASKGTNIPAIVTVAEAPHVPVAVHEGLVALQALDRAYVLLPKGDHQLGPAAPIPHLNGTPYVNMANELTKFTSTAEQIVLERQGQLAIRVTEVEAKSAKLMYTSSAVFQEFASEQGSFERFVRLRQDFGNMKERVRLMVEKLRTVEERLSQDDVMDVYREAHQAVMRQRRHDD